MYLARYFVNSEAPNAPNATQKHGKKQVLS